MNFLYAGLCRIRVIRPAFRAMPHARHTPFFSGYAACASYALIGMAMSSMTPYALPAALRLWDKSPVGLDFPVLKFRV